MQRLRLIVADTVFVGRLETERAPRTCAAFLRQVPFDSHFVHVRWSGEAVWIPLGDLDFGVGPENATSYPAPGEVLLYPGGISETEVLVAYGSTRFASKAGQLAGNHFLSIRDGLARLADIGRHTMWHGAMPLRFEAA